VINDEGNPLPEYRLGLYANMYPAFEGDYRGAFIHQMAKDLEARGIQVTIAAKTTTSLLGYLPFGYQSLILARNKELDLMQAEYIPHSSLIPALTKRQKIPLILKFHGDDARIFPFKNRFNMALTKLMLKKASHVVTASEEIRQILISLGTRPEAITAIHTGVDTQLFVEENKKDARLNLDLPLTKTIFLFAGRLHPWKGVPELIQVAQMCPNFLFLFVGPGKIPNHPKNCIFPGIIPHQDIGRWMNAADCLVLPTHTEAIPTSVLEAFACGIPSIATNVGGCPEIVTDRENGLIIPVGDIPHLKSAVNWMAEHPEERKLMGHQAKITVTERFDHIKQTDRLIKIHKSLLL